MPKITQNEIDKGFAFELDELDCATIPIIAQFYEDWVASAQEKWFIPDGNDLGENFCSEFGRGNSYYGIFGIQEQKVTKVESAETEQYEVKAGKAIITAAREKFNSKGFTNSYLQNCIFFAARQAQQPYGVEDRTISQLFPSTQIDDLFSLENSYLEDAIRGCDSVFAKPDGMTRKELKITKFDLESVTCVFDSYFFYTLPSSEQTKNRGVVTQTITFYADRSKPPKIVMSCSLPILEAGENKAFSAFTNTVKSIVEKKVVETRLAEAVTADLKQIKNPSKGKKANKLNSFIRSRSQMNKLFMGKSVANKARTAINNNTMLMLLRSIAGIAAEACRNCAGKTRAADARNELAAMENCEKALNRIFDRSWKHPFGYNFRNLLNRNDILIKQIVEELVPAAGADASEANTSAAAAKAPHKYPLYVMFLILSRLNKLDMKQETKELVGRALQTVSVAIDKCLGVASSPIAVQTSSPANITRQLGRVAEGAAAKLTAEQRATDAAQHVATAAQREATKEKQPAITPRPGAISGVAIGGAGASTTTSREAASPSRFPLSTS